MQSTDQIEVTLSSGATKSMKEAAINLIRSFCEEFTMDQFVEEMTQIDHVTDAEAVERYRNIYAEQALAILNHSPELLEDAKNGLAEAQSCSASTG